MEQDRENAEKIERRMFNDKIIKQVTILNEFMMKAKLTPEQLTAFNKFFSDYLQSL